MRHPTTLPRLNGGRGLIAAALVLLAGYGAGCGTAAATAPTAARASGGTNGARAAPLTATRSETSSSEPSLAGDQRIARDTRLRRSDLPPGWRVIPGPSLTTDVNCPGLTGAKAAVDARTSSPEFQRGEAAAVGAAYVYASRARAVRWFDQLSSAKTRACLGRVVRRALKAAEGSQGAAVSVSAQSAIIRPVGDQDAADRISVGLTAGGITHQAYLDFDFVRVGRGVAVFALASVGVIFDPALQARLAQKVAGRLAADLGSRAA